MGTMQCTARSRNESRGWAIHAHTASSGFVISCVGRMCCAPPLTGKRRQRHTPNARGVPCSDLCFLSYPILSYPILSTFSLLVHTPTRLTRDTRGASVLCDLYCRRKKETREGKTHVLEFW